MVFKGSLLLLLFGGVLAMALNGVVGEVLLIAGVIGILACMVRAANEDTSGRQQEIESRADAVRSEHQNPV